MLSTVAVQVLELHQMDVMTAFLHGDLDKDIYIEVPARFKDPSRLNFCVQTVEGILQTQASLASLAFQDRCVLNR